MTFANNVTQFANNINSFRGILLGNYLQSLFYEKIFYQTYFLYLKCVL